LLYEYLPRASLRAGTRRKLDLLGSFDRRDLSKDFATRNCPTASPEKVSLIVKLARRSEVQLDTAYKLPNPLLKGFFLALAVYLD
jgi:hypothetical protein